MPVWVTVIVALIAATASIVVSLISLLGSRQAQDRMKKAQTDLELFKADLALQVSTGDAWLAYEFEARKRLYEECAPLTFQLAEHSERALGRIYGLARTAAAGNLDPGKSWLSRGYYSDSTYYRLIAPLSVGRLIRRRLTHLDLSIDPIFHWYYLLVRVLMDSFTDDFDLAGKSGEVKIDRADWLEYCPHERDADELRLSDPRTYWQQGIPRGILDDAVTALIIDNEGVMEFMEFQAKRWDGNSNVARAFNRIAYVFQDFHPQTRPVLWRVLVAQAHIYEAILRVPRPGTPQQETLGEIPRLEAARLNWRTPGAPGSSDEVDQAIRVAAAYAIQCTKDPFERSLERAG